jgi:pyruvate ferredoxin oxidoreductase gamma subunit
MVSSDRIEHMFQIRIHGRGGQGVVTAAELLSVAAFLEGKHAQAFPSFGSERMGAPVVSFCRLDDKEIRLREPIAEPDALIIQDTTLLHSVDVFQGLRADGYILINSIRDFEELGIADFVAGFPPHHVCDVGATELALKHVKRPLPNAALLGGFAAISGQLGMDSVAAAIMEKFPGAVGEANVRAAREAFDIAKAA